MITITIIVIDRHNQWYDISIIHRNSDGNEVEFMSGWNKFKRCNSIFGFLMISPLAWPEMNHDNLKFSVIFGDFPLPCFPVGIYTNSPTSFFFLGGRTLPPTVHDDPAWVTPNELLTICRDLWISRALIQYSCGIKHGQLGIYCQKKENDQLIFDNCWMFQ